MADFIKNVFVVFLCCLLSFFGNYFTFAFTHSHESSLNCNLVAEYYGKYVDSETRDVVPSKPISDAGLGVCGHTLKFTDYKSCCNGQMEENFIRKSTPYLQEHVQLSNTKLKLKVLSNLDLYHDHIKRSLNHTRAQASTTLSQLFHIPKEAFRPPLDVFFTELEDFVKGEALSLENIISTFFNNLFPHVFEHVLSDAQKFRELGNDFRKCLLDSYGDVKPFGRVPSEIVKLMRNAFDRARIFSESLRVMQGVVETADTLDMDPHCKRAVTKLNYCSLCSGVPEAKPCRGLCLNVMRGCLTYVKDLSPSWDDLVGQFEKFQHGMFQRRGAKEVLAELNVYLKAAVLRIMDDTPRVYRLVNHKCHHTTNSTLTRKYFSIPEGRGAPKFSISRRTPAPGHRLQAIRDDIRQLTTQLRESRGFLQRIADDLCREEMLYDPVMSSDTCWNGSAVGRYEHMVPEASTISQATNNVEVKVSLRGNAQVVQQKDKLEHTKRRLITLLNEEAMQQDEAYQATIRAEEMASTNGGSEGSSVGGPSSYTRQTVTINDDEDYNWDVSSGSGSGDGYDTETGESEDKETATGEKDKGGGKHGGCSGGNCGGDTETGSSRRDGDESAGSRLRVSVLSTLVLPVFLWTVHFVQCSVL